MLAIFRPEALAHHGRERDREPALDFLRGRYLGFLWLLTAVTIGLTALVWAQPIEAGGRPLISYLRPALTQPDSGAP